MKNLIITFLLVFTFAFAAEDESNTATSESTIACVEVTLSCGPTGPVCGATFADLMRNIAWAENHFCGGGPQQ